MINISFNLINSLYKLNNSKEEKMKIEIGLINIFKCKFFK